VVGPGLHIGRGAAYLFEDRARSGDPLGQQARAHRRLGRRASRAFPSRLPRSSGRGPHPWMLPGSRVSAGRDRRNEAPRSADGPRRRWARACWRVGLAPSAVLEENPPAPRPCAGLVRPRPSLRRFRESLKKTCPTGGRGGPLPRRDRHPARRRSAARDPLRLPEAVPPAQCRLARSPRRPPRCLSSRSGARPRSGPRREPSAHTREGDFGKGHDAELDRRANSPTTPTAPSCASRRGARAHGISP